MNCFTYRTDIININIGGEKSFIDVKTLNTGINYSLKAPVFEIDRKSIEFYPLKKVQLEKERDMFNGGKEVIFSCTIDKSKDVLLYIYLQLFLESPFIRYKYELRSEAAVVLTKSEGKDNIRYTGIMTRFSNSLLTELQFSQFNPKVHSYNPNFDMKSEGELVNGCKYPGPITLLESTESCILLAYEHGAEYPDTYLTFDEKLSGNILSLNICAEKGNYFDGEIIDKKHKFITPWFHIAAVPGGRVELFKHYRTFFLKYICEHSESRKPYIFYNTWNYQERNKCINGKKYLDSMNLDQILKEIDVAHRLGVEVFVIDTGWFTKAGDWLVNLERFPDGLAQVKQRLSDYDMKLGLWFNPISAAAASDTYKNNIEYRLTQNDKGVTNISWENEENYVMCLASGFSDIFIKKMLQLYKELGVTYFKWDGISQYGCESPHHNHGNEANTIEERLQCYSYKMGMEMIRIVEEVSKQCPDIIVDFDVTECGRFAGLGFLSVGKYFLVNNGPYAMDFDLPEKLEAATNQVAVNLSPYTNMFFFPGPARSRICRQGTKYDSFVPSILFLTHYLPDAPIMSQNNSLASIVLGGNGIWGDLLSLSDEDILLYSSTLNRYKEVARSVTESYPIAKGFIGSSPEIYEKIDHEKAKGIVCFFTRAKGTYTYITDKIRVEGFSNIFGADHFEVTHDGRLKITVILGTDDARIVFIL
ncbi:MAG TPA: alpha-galactosidase [Ruminiclostridium sp.]